MVTGKKAVRKVQVQERDTSSKPYNRVWLVWGEASFVRSRGACRGLMEGRLTGVRKREALSCPSLCVPGPRVWKLTFTPALGAGAGSLGWVPAPTLPGFVTVGTSHVLSGPQSPHH